MPSSINLITGGHFFLSRDSSIINTYINNKKQQLHAICHQKEGTLGCICRNVSHDIHLV